MLRKLIKVLKKIPVDLGQYEVRYNTKGKVIAFEFVEDGRHKKALDLGCRDGYWSEKLKQKGYELISCDLEPHYASAMCMDASKPFPFLDNEFSLVWFVEVIEHLPDPAGTLAEVKRVLEPGGTLLLTTPNIQFWLFKMLELMGISQKAIQNEAHLQFFTYQDFNQLLAGCETYGYFPYVINKQKIQKFADVLSPTIVVRYQNPSKRTMANRLS